MTLVTAQNSLPNFRRLHTRTLETTVLTAFPFQIRTPGLQLQTTQREGAAKKEELSIFIGSRLDIASINGHFPPSTSW